MARKGSNRKILKDLGLTPDIKGAWHKFGKYYSPEDAETEIANATGLEIGTPEFNEFIASVSPSKKHGGNPDVLFWNRISNRGAKYGVKGSDALRSEIKNITTGKNIYQRKNKEITEYFIERAFLKYTAEMFIGKSREEKSELIKEAYGVDTVEEAFEEFKSKFDIEEFAKAVLRVDEKMLKKFGLDDSEIEELRGMSEEQKYHYVTDRMTDPEDIKLQ